MQLLGAIRHGFTRVGAADGLLGEVTLAILVKRGSEMPGRVIFAWAAQEADGSDDVLALVVEHGD